VKLYGLIESDRRFVTAIRPELDIVTWAFRSSTAAEASRRAREIFERAAAANLHLALANLPASWFGWPDAETVTSLRSVLMKPEHLDWVGRIWDIVNTVT
jgi:hypothetical protein